MHFIIWNGKTSDDWVHFPFLRICYSLCCLLMPMPSLLVDCWFATIVVITCSAELLLVYVTFNLLVYWMIILNHPKSLWPSSSTATSSSWCLYRYKYVSSLTPGGDFQATINQTAHYTALLCGKCWYHLWQPACYCAAVVPMLMSHILFFLIFLHLFAAATVTAHQTTSSAANAKIYPLLLVVNCCFLHLSCAVATVAAVHHLVINADSALIPHNDLMASSLAILP